MEHADDSADTSLPSVQAQIARAVVAALLITTAAWMMGSYFLDTLGVPFLAK